MTQKLKLAGLTTGSADLYCRFLDAEGRYWRGDTAEWEAYNAANLATYGADAGSGTPYNAGTEDGATGVYQFSVPALAAGTYTALVYEQAGAAPVASDTYKGGGAFEWDGSSLVSLATVKDLLEADLYIDDSVSPWQAVLIKKDSGTLDTGTVLLRKDLKDINGVDLGAITTFVGQQISP